MAYNMSKYVEAAQKLLNQGKVPQAINEYQHILKYEPKDQVTLMTIGELYIRQGETFQAIEYFERLAQIFVGDGFLTKAIAVYKRIAKLAPEEIKPLERLADLYVQQGVMSEARPLFLQLAEIHLKHNRQAEAVARRPHACRALSPCGRACQGTGLWAASLSGEGGHLYRQISIPVPLILHISYQGEPGTEPGYAEPPEATVRCTQKEPARQNKETSFPSPAHLQQ